jgi:hypothetical protein
MTIFLSLTICLLLSFFISLFSSLYLIFLLSIFKSYSTPYCISFPFKQRGTGPAFPASLAQAVLHALDTCSSSVDFLEIATVYGKPPY